MKKSFIFILLILLTACSTQTFDTCDANEDGKVDTVEKNHCVQGDDESDEEDIAEEKIEYYPTSGKTYPLYFSVMIHMEEDFKDDTNADLFALHEKELYWGMDLFEEYDAKMTIESAQPFAIAIIQSDSPLFNDALERGHGVGTHCGKEVKGNTVAQLATAYETNKDLVDQIVGKNNNRGCSGGWGSTDYVRAATEAGFGYLDGVVYLAYLSMDQSLRPDQVSDEDIRDIYYHDPVLPEMSEHIYPRFLENAEDFVEDADGELVLLNGELGEIASLDEGRKNCSPDCALSEEDFQVIYDAIEEASSIRDPQRVAHLYVHIPVKNYDEDNEELLRSFLSHMQELQEEGKIVWATQGEVYDAKLSERE